MYKIISKQILSDAVKLVVVEAPHVAKKAAAGHFVIVRSHDESERIPLTIADFDRAAGTVTLIFQEVGKSTREMGLLAPGDAFATVMGPLGHATEIANFGTVVVVGGGVGIAPVFPIARALKEAGNRVLSIIGARNASLLFWEERMREVSDELIVMTDDGSRGRKGLVTEPLKELLDRGGAAAGGQAVPPAPGRALFGGVAKVWAIGPAIMMKFVALASRPYAVPTIVSLNTVMVDGTGMCGGCRVSLEGGAKFVCVDGPEFDGHLVDWDLLLSRMTFYRGQEAESIERWGKDHACRLDAAGENV